MIQDLISSRIRNHNLSGLDKRVDKIGCQSFSKCKNIEKLSEITLISIDEDISILSEDETNSTLSTKSDQEPQDKNNENQTIEMCQHKIKSYTNKSSIFGGKCKYII